jgi:hypothetical protein
MGGSDPYHFTLVSRPPSETPDHGWVSDNLITSRWYLDHPVKPLTIGGSDPYHFMLVSRPPTPHFIQRNYVNYHISEIIKLK